MDIKDSVGEGGRNAVHDVAMVQLMLRLVKNAQGAPYFNYDYNGTWDGATKTAIVAFQTDQKLVDPALAKAQGPALGARPVRFDKAGVLAPNSASLKALTALVPVQYQKARIIEDTKTVYLPMEEQAAKQNAATIQAKIGLDANFRASVAAMVTEMYSQHKIVLSIPNDGWRRSFAEQARVAAGATGAGPGESNHQYGKAVDIGFNGLKWVAGNGQIMQTDYWLQHMPAAKADQFWEARNKIRDQLGLFKTNKAGDLIHVQAYSDNHVSYGRSLAALLQTASPKHMKWEAVPGHPNRYKSDLSLGGPSASIGTANQIWANSSPISKADLSTVLNARMAADKNFKVEAFFNLPPTAPRPAQAVPVAAKNKGPAPLKEADIRMEYILATRKLLKQEFEAADAHWKDWKALP